VNPYSWDIFAGSLVALVLLAAALRIIVPQFTAVYAQLKVQLPSLTASLLKLSGAACRHPIVLGAIVVLVPWRLGRFSGRSASLARVILLLLALITLGWMMAALFLPLTGLLLEGNGARRP
jgi:type II secretory pathway component PulF